MGPAAEEDRRRGGGVVLRALKRERVTEAVVGVAGAALVICLLLVVEGPVIALFTRGPEAAWAKLMTEFALARYGWGPPSADEAEDRMIALDDCLAKAAATQPPGRPLKPLVTELRATCAYSIEAALLALTTNLQPEEEAKEALYRDHILPAARRAKPQ
jgi:hypothetical protein